MAAYIISKNLLSCNEECLDQKVTWSRYSPSVFVIATLYKRNTSYILNCHLWCVSELRQVVMVAPFSLYLIIFFQIRPLMAWTVRLIFIQPPTLPHLPQNHFILGAVHKSRLMLDRHKKSLISSTFPIFEVPQATSDGYTPAK